MRVRKSAEDRKAEIESATLALAYEHGPAQVTTTMIAERLGMTQPAIYKHFPNKTELWQSITRTLGARIADNIANARTEAATPLEQLRHLALGQLRLVHDTPALPEIMLMRDRTVTQEAVRQEIHANMGRFQQAMVEMIVQSQKDGSLRRDTAPSDVAALIMGLIQSLILRSLVSRDPTVLLRDGDRLLDLQLSAFSQQATRE